MKPAVQRCKESGWALVLFRDLPLEFKREAWAGFQAATGSHGTGLIANECLIEEPPPRHKEENLDQETRAYLQPCSARECNPSTA
jgi:hypothetical protein